MSEKSNYLKEQAGSSSNINSTKEPSTRMKELIAMSHNITVDRIVSIDKYFKSGRELIKSAAGFEEKGDLEKAFILYLRYMTLFLEKIIHHPDYNKADKQEKNLVKNECNNVFELAEKLKKKIMDKYNEEYKQYLDLSNNPEENKLVEKRSIKPNNSALLNCDIDEIDRKFNFTEQTAKDQSDKGFDPFNIEELQRSFNSTRE